MVVVEIGSNSGFQTVGFQTGERCWPQSRFMNCLLMCMASIVLLFQYLMVVAWALAAHQSMECCIFCTCTDIPFMGSPFFTAYLCSFILFFIVLVSRMYASWQSRQGTSFTTCLGFSFVILGLTFGVLALAWAVLGVADVVFAGFFPFTLCCCTLFLPDVKRDIFIGGLRSAGFQDVCLSGISSATFDLLVRNGSNSCDLVCIALWIKLLTKGRH